MMASREERHRRRSCAFLAGALLGGLACASPPAPLTAKGTPAVTLRKLDCHAVELELAAAERLVDGFAMFWRQGI